MCRLSSASHTELLFVILHFGRCRIQADRLSAGQHPHHHHPQHQSVEQSANRSVTTIMFPPVSEQVQSSTGGSASASATASGTSRDRSSSSAFLLTSLVLRIHYHYQLACVLVTNTLMDVDQTWCEW